MKLLDSYQRKKQKPNRFAIKNNQMVLEEIGKSKFVQINDERYYLSDGNVLLPFSHPFLLDIVKFKRKKQKIETFLQQEKHNLFRWKNLSSKKTK